jgi:ferredoxin-NADP reductase
MKLKLVQKKQEVEGVKSFFLEPEKKIDFEPGQYFYYTLPKLDFPDERGPMRHFTIANSPTESGLMLTTRIREQSGFKKTLDALPIGSIVEGDGPQGTFTFRGNSEKNVFITGGIGITPFRSMIKYLIDTSKDTPIHLLYSNSSPDEIIYHEELIKWSQGHPFLSLDFTVTNPNPGDNWKGLTGRINENMIKSLPIDLENSTFWVTGTPPMVTAIEELLENMQINEDKIQTEKFTGY